jgi:SAM-dependent methyltransferase
MTMADTHVDAGLDDDLRETAARAAARHGVSPAIQGEDFIFRFLYENSSFASKHDAVIYYFDDAARSALQLKALLDDVCQVKDRAMTLLEFASGFGCLTRHLTGALPLAATTSCDIHPKAVDFLSGTLQAPAILSTIEPADFQVPRPFDVVFALSFFSHMPKRTFASWLDSLGRCVAAGGHLIFTTHGESSARYFPACTFDEDGFYFRADSEQKDLDAAHYGQAVVRPWYVLDAIRTRPFSLELFREGYWWGHQDLYVLKRA